MKSKLLLFCLLSLGRIWAQKPPLEYSIKGQYAYLDGSTVMNKSGLLFVGYSRRDDWGRGFSYALGFPLYPETVVIGAHQKYCLGLDVGYRFKSLISGKRSFLHFEPRALLMARAEEDRLDEYVSGDSLYPYSYARIHSMRFGIHPSLVYTHFLSTSFLLELSAGFQSYVEKVSYSNIITIGSKARPVQGSSNQYYHVGWNRHLNEFLGLRIIYKIN